MTLKEALLKCREDWLHYFHTGKGYDPDNHRCQACVYSKGLESLCRKNCIIPWPIDQQGGCFDTHSPYPKWKNARDSKTRKMWAFEIIKLVDKALIKKGW